MPRNAPGRVVRVQSGRGLYVDARGDSNTAGAGEGQVASVPVLFVHGFASNHEVWDTIEPSLRATRRTVRVDLPGFGWSERAEGDYSPSAIAEDLVAVMDRLGIARTDVVAHSWGSSVSLALALAHPERVRRIVLIGAWVYDEQIPPFFRWAREPGVGEALFTLFYRERPEDRAPLGFPEGTEVPQSLVDAIERSLERPGTVRAALAAVRGQYLLHMERRYRTVRHPALLVYGAQDRVARPRFGARLATDLRDARLEVLQGVGHFPMLESAGHTRRLVRAFLDGPDDGAAPVAPQQSSPAAQPSESPAAPASATTGAGG